MEKITDLERAAICLHIFGGCTDRKTLYVIAVGVDKFNKLKESSINPTISKWYNSHKIQQTIEHYKSIQEKEKRKIIEEYTRKQEGEANNGGGKTGFSESVDFLNLDEFLQYANQQANNIQDEKEKRAWVEMIGKYMNFKESDEGEAEQIKAYLPMTCDKCEIYRRCKGCTFERCSQLV